MRLFWVFQANPRVKAYTLKLRGIVLVNNRYEYIETVMCREAITVNVCLQTMIFWEKLTFPEFQITSNGVIKMLISLRFYYFQECHFYL